MVFSPRRRKERGGEIFAPLRLRGEKAAKKFLKIIDLITNVQKQSVPGEITASVDNRWLYVCTTAQNQVVMIDTSGWTVPGRINTGNGTGGNYFSIVTIK